MFLFLCALVGGVPTRPRRRLPFLPQLKTVIVALEEAIRNATPQVRFTFPSLPPRRDTSHTVRATIRQHDNPDLCVLLLFPSCSKQTPGGVTHPGNWFFQMLHTTGITVETKDEFIVR